MTTDPMIGYPASTVLRINPPACVVDGFKAP